MATFVLSAFMAFSTGYVYGLEIRLETYTSLARALAALIGATVLALMVVGHSLKVKQGQLEHRLMRWLEAQGDWVPREWDLSVERTIEEKAQVSGVEGFEVEEALNEKRSLARKRRYATRLFALPLAAMSVIVAISLWAVPAAGAFLEHNAFINTTLVFLTSYGTLMAVGSFVAALFLVLKD